MFNRRNKLVFGSVVILLTLFLVGCQRNKAQDLNLDSNDQASTTDESQSEDQKLIGGDQDAHGCLIAAGYSWCQSKNKCLRTWEETCPIEQTEARESIIFEDLEWKKNSNDFFAYSVDYPTIVNIMGNNLDEHVEFNGQLVDNEWWPQISISHYNNDFYRPSTGADVSQWVKPFPGYGQGEKISIAGLDTVHYVQEKTSTAWATDYFYFIKDGQLYNITIIHTNDQENWQIYKKILNSFSFED